MVEEIGILLIGGLLGFLSNFLFQRIKERAHIIYVSQNHQQIAQSHDEYWGQIKVLYNGNETGHVRYTSIELDNQSNRDLDGFDLLIYCANNSRIIAAETYNFSTGMVLTFTPEYYQYMNDQKNEWINQTRQFRVNAFNRKSTIKVDLLIDSDEYYDKDLDVKVEKKGLILKPLIEEDQKVLGLKVIFGGIIIFLAAFALIVWNQKRMDEWLIYALLGILGCSHFLLGALAVQISKSLKNLIK